jgi:hypothetical protein
VVAGSNTVTLALRVVGVDEKDNSAWRYNCATLFLGDLNKGSWPSRLGKTRIWDSKIWSCVLWDSDPRMTALVRVSSNFKRETNPLVREDFILVSWGGVGLNLLGTSVTNWPIEKASDDRLLVWSSRWMENWQRKPKHSEKTCPSATLSTTNPTWSDLCSNPSRYTGKPRTNRLNCSTVPERMLHKEYNRKCSVEKEKWSWVSRGLTLNLTDWR